MRSKTGREGHSVCVNWHNMMLNKEYKILTSKIPQIAEN